MSLYLEYVILDNLIMDYLLIRMLEDTYKFKFKKINIWLACILGAIASLILPYFYNQILILNIFRILLANVIVLMLRKYKNFKQYCTYLLLFFSYTFVLGGIILGIIFMFKIDYSMSGIIIYSFEFPVSIFILIVYFAIKLFKKILSRSSKEITFSEYLLPITIFSKVKSVDGVGLIDTGNSLELNGVGVNIISLDLFLKLYKDFPVEKILLRDIAALPLKDARYIEVNGLGKNGSYLSFIMEKMKVGENIFTDVRVAVTIKNFSKFDCILSSKMLIR